MRKGDVAVGISHSGTTTETIEALAAAGDTGATTIALTNFPLSRLASGTDLVLTTSARETNLRSGATASRIAALTIVDCLYLAVAQRDLGRARKAVAETRRAVGSHHVIDQHPSRVTAQEIDQPSASDTPTNYGRSGRLTGCPARRGEPMNDTPHRPGLGSMPHSGGTAFRVWAPHADAVAVTGSFTEWSSDGHAMDAEDDGHWYADIAGVEPGAEYQFVIHNGDQRLMRIDPRARAVTNSSGNGLVYDRDAFDWQGDSFACPPHDQLVIYETHIGSFMARRRCAPPRTGWTGCSPTSSRPRTPRRASARSR